MELRKHRQVGAIPQVLRGEIPPPGSRVLQQSTAAGNLDRKVAIHTGQVRTALRSDKIQVLKRIVVYGCVSDPAPRIRIDSIQLLQDDGGLGVTHPLKPICGHIPLAHGCMFRIQSPIHRPETPPDQRECNRCEHKRRGGSIDGQAT